MKKKADLTKMGAGVFYKYIYPVVARDFLLGDDYEEFAQLVSVWFVLTPEQWQTVLYEWELKEQILSN